MPVPPIDPSNIQLTDLDKQIYAALNADPEARSKLLPEVKRLFPNVPLNGYDEKVAAEKSVEERVKPLMERIDELQAKIKQKDDNEFWENQRNILRKDGVPDTEIKKFEERMAKEWSGGQMDYGDIYRYFQLKDAPLSPSSAGIGFSGARRSDMEEDWRTNLKNDPTKNPSHKLFKGNKARHFKDRWDQLGGLRGNNR